MAFMRRDVNLGLLILIIAAILLFAGFSVYYQTSFRDVSTEYKGKLEQLQKVTKELITQKQQLNETYALRVKAEQDRKALDSSYKGISDENEQLEKDKANLQSELSSTKSNLAEKSAQLDATNNLLAQIQSELSSTKSERDSLRSKWKKVCEDYTSLNNGEEHDKC